MTNGYPDDEDLEWLKQELATDDFDQGALALMSLLELTGYAKTRLWKGRLEVATGGWSGCEDILGATHLTLWRSRFWRSIHRGGLHKFGVDHD